MAQRDLNPSLSPTQDPDYLKQSKLTSAPDVIKPTGQANNTILPEGAKLQGNTYESKEGLYKGKAEGMAWSSAGEQLAGLASLGDFAAKAGDTLVKKDIDETTYTAVDRERQAYTSALEKTIGVSTPNGESILEKSSDQKDVPDDVKKVVPAVTSLAGAKAAGKIPETYYLQRLNTIAKDMRSQYPGYRDYIDHAISRVSGKDPANAYLHILQQQYNTATAAKAEKVSAAEKALLHEVDKGNPLSMEVYKKFKQGNIDEMGVHSFINQSNIGEYQLKAMRDAQAAEKGDREIQALRANDRVDKTSMIVGGVDAVGINTITGNNTTSLDAVQKSFSELQRANGGKPPDPEQVRQLGATLEALKVSGEQKIRAQFDPRDVALIGGPEKLTEKIKNTAYMRSVDGMLTALKDQNFGAVHMMHNANEAAFTRAGNALVTNANTADVVSSISWLSKNAQAYAVPFATKMIAEGKDKDVVNFLATSKVQLIANQKLTQDPLYTTGTNSTPVRPPEPVNIKTKVDEVSNLNISSSERKTVLKGLVETPTALVDPMLPDAQKISLANSFYSPATAGVISQFVRDGYDSQTGRRIPGGASIYKSWYSKDIADQVVKLDAQFPSSGIRQDFVNSGERAFTQELFQREIMDLNKFQLDPKLLITWDDKHHQFNVVERKERQSLASQSYSGLTLTPSEQALNKTAKVPSGYVEAKTAIDRINTGLQGFVNVAEVAGSKDVTKYLFEHMVDMGFDPTISRPIGIPEGLMKALIAAKDEAQIQARKRQIPNTFDPFGFNRPPNLPSAADSTVDRTPQRDQR